MSSSATDAEAAYDASVSDRRIELRLLVDCSLEAKSTAGVSLEPRLYSKKTVQCTYTSSEAMAMLVIATSTGSTFAAAAISEMKAVVKAEVKLALLSRPRASLGEVAGGDLGVGVGAGEVEEEVAAG
ncbi:hypothetical protein CYMTET_36282 [Cymbomonas tetramitiformis]|uniref:Uncharacterized protein n=1 Tax=Cymbomonas tetramitiformis TaxID=36881 RepID=A0AAE0CII2_9CHLO|nr:hypothetical protein CYMTET_36282 [Cymbomonas tetramitiformis]